MPQTMKDAVEEAERRDLEPTFASLRWCSTCADEIKEEVTMDTGRGRHKYPFKKIKILGYIFNPVGKSHECLEERM